MTGRMFHEPGVSAGHLTTVRGREQATRRAPDRKGGWEVGSSGAQAQSGAAFGERLPRSLPLACVPTVTSEVRVVPPCAFVQIRVNCSPQAKSSSACFCK